MFFPCDMAEDASGPRKSKKWGSTDHRKAQRIVTICGLDPGSHATIQVIPAASADGRLGCGNIPKMDERRKPMQQKNKRKR